MKVLYVDTETAGHHNPYLRAISNPANENVYILPEQLDGLNGKVYSLQYARGFKNHFRWTRQVNEIAKSENADIVHYVYGDIFLKMFGIGLCRHSRKKAIVSLHRFDNSFLKNVSRNRIAKKVKAIISHVMGAERLLNKRNADKIHFVVYPSVLENLTFTIQQARDTLGIQSRVPVIAIVGVMAQYKGLDVLFDALEKTAQPYSLIIAGKPGFYTEEYVRGRVDTLQCDAKMMFRYISDEEFVMCIAASDIVAVPYAINFEGTSGPMSEAIRLRKTIVGCTHSNIGQIIAEYGVGYMADAGDVQGLARAFDQAIEYPVQYDKKMEEIMMMQTIDAFRKRVNEISLI